MRSFDPQLNDVPETASIYAMLVDNQDHKHGTLLQVSTSTQKPSTSPSSTISPTAGSMPKFRSKLSR
jgi:hypothetical protein